MGTEELQKIHGFAGIDPEDPARACPRRSYGRVVLIFACPSHSCTLAMSALFVSALVAAVARPASGCRGRLPPR
jgi:hypothetical protein